MKFLKYGEEKSSKIVFNSNSPPNVAIIVKINTERNWQDNVASVLYKLEGVHKFELDVEQGTVKILGTMQPHLLMRVLNKSTRNAVISKAYMMKDGVTEDIFAPPEDEQPCTCTCPNCAPPQNQCCHNNYNRCYYNNNNYNSYSNPYYDYHKLGYYDYNNNNNNCANQQLQCSSSPPRQLLLPPPPAPPAPCYGMSYYPNYPPSPGWPQPVHVEPYYENESHGCSIM